MTETGQGGVAVGGAAASHGSSAPLAAQEPVHSEGHLATAPFHERVREALGDARLQGAVRASTERLSGAYAQVAAGTPEFAALRHQAGEIRRRTLQELDRHLETLADNVERNGGHVY